MSDHTEPILVTGGTGTTGSRLAAYLREHGARVRIGTRTPDRDTLAKGAAVRLDWNDPTTFSPAVSGIERLYLLRPNVFGGDPRSTVERFLSVARSEGVRRVVLLHSTVTGAAAMPEIAEAVETSMPEWAVLCPSWFMQNFTGSHPHARAIVEKGEIATATGEGRLGFIDADDIAAAAAAALLAEEPPRDRYVLTGPDSLSYRDIAESLGKVTGRSIHFRVLTADQLAERWRAIGLPEPQIAMAVELDLAIARGEHDYTTTTVEDLTGRRPRSFHRFAERNRSVWS